jgi:hypothetical protein
MNSAAPNGGTLVIALAMLLGGCALHRQPPPVVECNMTMQGDRSRIPALVGQEYGVQASPIPVNSVQFSKWDTAYSLAVQRLFAARTATNTVAVTARFISCSDVPFAIRVRTSFLDANQAPTEAASAWQTVYLQPRLTATYQERSVSPRAALYLIEVMGD